MKKTVIITGAAGGIGRVLCKHFYDLGACVGGIDINPNVSELSKELQGGQGAFHSATADITDEKSVNAAISELRSALGPVTTLVNNAGFVKERRMDTTTFAGWNYELMGNLGGAFLCVAAVIDDLKQCGDGVIINIGSVNGLTTIGHPAYSAAKAGLESFTKTLACEYASFGVRANMIAPATVHTPVWSKRFEDDPDLKDRLLKNYPLGRLVKPVDIAHSVAFLASDNARSITGVTLPVDCGLLAGNAALLAESTSTRFDKIK